MMGFTDKKRIVNRKKIIRSAALHLVLLAGSAIFILPFAWLLVTSVKQADQVFKYPPEWIPTRQVNVSIDGKEYGLSILKREGRNVRVAEIADVEDGKWIRILAGQPGAGRKLLVARPSLRPVRKFGMNWDNYSRALDFMPKETHKGLLCLWNTVYITALSILGTVLTSSLVAYSFARLNWPGRDVLFGVLLATMMLPQAVTMVPVFLIFCQLGWVDTLRPLWVPSFLGGAFAIFLLRQFFLTIPTDLEDAAKIDGCPYFMTFWKIMLPLIKPALAAITIITFISSWNNFMGPLIYINSPEKMPLSYALQLFQNAHNTEYGMLMAMSTLFMLPVLVVFFLAQKYFIEGIALTGIKG